MDWAVLGSLTGLLGLLGVLVGAGLTAAFQSRAARRAREAADHAAARAAVGELLATSEVTRGLYETVWLLDEGGRRPRPQEAYQRAVDAWADYQRARYGVRMAAPDGVYQHSRELTALLEQETAAIDAVYRRETGARPLTQNQITTIADQVAELHTAILAETARTVPGPRWAPAPPRGTPAAPSTGTAASGPAPSASATSEPAPGSPTAATR